MVVMLPLPDLLCVMKNLFKLIDNLTTIAKKRLTGMDLQPVLHADVELPLSELKPSLL